MAEYYVAHEFGIFWDPRIGAVGGKGRWADVGPYQVRSTYAQKGHLILHHDDLDDEIFILVIGLHGKYRMAGWLQAGDGKLQEYWGELEEGSGRFNFNVPQDKLEPMSSFGKTGPQDAEE